MKNSVIRAIKRYNMIDGAGSITVALSGGADSVALLLCLKQLEDELSVKISAAHLNHCLRGEESERDERFVRDICSRLGVPLTVERADIRLEAEKSGESIELAARRVRYAFLESTAPELIATAHTANDNIETVLHNMARGTGIAGLCGIPPKRGRIIRPLIFTERSEIERFCCQNGESFCIDSTNSDQAYTRNRIRHSVVPELLKINTAVVANAAQMSEILRDDADYLDSVTNEAFIGLQNNGGLSCEGLSVLHNAVKHRCISKYYAEVVGKVPENRHVAAICELLEHGGRVTVHNGFSASVENGVFKLIPPKTEAVLPKTEVLTFPTAYFGVLATAESVENLKNTSKFNSLLLNNAVDCDKICGRLIFRGRENGDSIRLRGRNCTKSFKKLFNEAKTERSLRDILPVLCDEKGVVWLCGFGVDERCAVTEESRSIIILNSENKGEENG